MRTVLAHGTFDLLHVGHLRFFEQAARLGDRLVVSITADKFVNKGPGRPIFTQEERKYSIERIKGVDLVWVCPGPTGLKAIDQFKPLFYVKGGDYKYLDKHGYLETEKIHVEALGGHLVILEGPRYSSTGIIDRVSKLKEQHGTQARREGGVAA